MPALADFRAAPFPKDLDVVVAFASLIHVAPTEFQAILARAHRALRPGGVVSLSLLHGDGPGPHVRAHTLGPQVVYRYTFADVITLTHQAYYMRHIRIEAIRGTDWLEVPLQTQPLNTPEVPDPASA